jgi:hypothetical protein
MSSDMTTATMTDTFDNYNYANGDWTIRKRIRQAEWNQHNKRAYDKATRVQWYNEHRHPPSGKDPNLTGETVSSNDAVTLPPTPLQTQPPPVTQEQSWCVIM